MVNASCLRKSRACAGLIILSILLSACGGGASAPPTTTPPNNNLPDDGIVTVPPDMVDVPVTSTAGDKVTVSGRVTFDLVPFKTAGNGLDYDNIVREPVRGAPVEAISASDNKSVLAATTSTNDGRYSLAVPQDTRIFIRVKARMQQTGAPSWDFLVVDNTSAQALYVMDSGTLNTGTKSVTKDLHAASGWDGLSYSEPRVAAPFAILDAVYDAVQVILAADSTAQFPPLLLNWSTNNRTTVGDIEFGQIGTSHYQDGEIYILGDADSDTDEYDRHVVIHEWSHYFEDTFSRADSIGGAHGTGDRLDVRLAFGEGWGNAFSGMVTGDAIYRDSGGTGQRFQLAAINLESNSITNAGWYSEGSVQSILYDIFDDEPDASDTVALGFGPIYDVLTNEQKTTPAFTSIFSFISALKQRQPDAAAAINALVSAQDIVSDGIEPFAGSETNNASAPDVLPLYTNMALDALSVVCSNDQFGVNNKLSVRRFLRFDVPSRDRYVIEVNGGGEGTDPDFVLHQMGSAMISRGLGTEEVSSVNLNSGTYLLEVYEWSNAFTSAGLGRVCFNVRVSQP